MAKKSGKKQRLLRLELESNPIFLLKQKNKSKKRKIKVKTKRKK